MKIQAIPITSICGEKENLLCLKTSETSGKQQCFSTGAFPYLLLQIIPF